MSSFNNTRIFSTPPSKVFAAIQDPARLARWWGPNGFTNTFETFEFTKGGAWCFTMHGPDGKDYVNQSQFLEIVPHSLVRIEHLNLPHFELTISLHPHANGTRLSWDMIFEDHTFAENAREFLHSANEQNLDRLVHEINTHQPSDHC